MASLTPILPMSCRRKPYRSSGSAASSGSDCPGQLERELGDAPRVTARLVVAKLERRCQGGDGQLVRFLQLGQRLGLGGPRFAIPK